MSNPSFDGDTFVAERDSLRLNAQLTKVFTFMSGGGWRTLSQIAEHCGSPEASVSARLRDLRKPKFGGFQVERRFVKRGLHEYRLLPKAESPQQELV